jgi:hypothetical protein
LGTLLGDKISFKKDSTSNNNGKSDANYTYNGAANPRPPRE